MTPCEARDTAFMVRYPVTMRQRDGGRRNIGLAGVDVDGGVSVEMVCDTLPASLW